MNRISFHSGIEATVCVIGKHDGIGTSRVQPLVDRRDVLAQDYAPI